MSFLLVYQKLTKQYRNGKMVKIGIKGGEKHPEKLGENVQKKIEEKNQI